MCGNNDGEILVIDGKRRCIDKCLIPIVKALNEGGVKTSWCCCGHGWHPGQIALEDGRQLVIMNAEAADLHVRSFGKTIYGEPLLSEESR